jgi:hypothetical protein
LNRQIRRYAFQCARQNNFSAHHQSVCVISRLESESTFPGSLPTLGQHRSTQRKVPRGRDDERRLTADIIELARQYGRYGYRKVAALLR